MSREDSARTETGREDNSRVLRDLALRDMTPAAQLVEPMKKINVVDDEKGDEEAHILDGLEAEQQLPVNASRDRARRPRRRKGKKGVEEAAQDLGITPAKETTKSKGWRQTPLLEPNPSFQPYSTLKGRGRKNGRMEENGWATEDATDVQEMGDFDFEGGLAKFDKHAVFHQLQEEDSVADEDRLVAHNRLPKAKPGTAAGKNLHFTENVLDMPKSTNGTPKVKAKEWNSEASDREERTSQRGSGSGRHSRRAESKLATNRKPADLKPISRKGSATQTLAPPARTLSVSLFSRLCHPTILIALRYLPPLVNRLSTSYHLIAVANPSQPFKCSIWRISPTMNWDCLRT